jgi:hypothetical protein
MQEKQECRPGFHCFTQRKRWEAAPFGARICKRLRSSGIDGNIPVLLKILQIRARLSISVNLNKDDWLHSLLVEHRASNDPQLLYTYLSLQTDHNYLAGKIPLR